MWVEIDKSLVVECVKPSLCGSRRALSGRRRGSCFSQWDVHFHFFTLFHEAGVAPWIRDKVHYIGQRFFTESAMPRVS